jgi:hypothetical protein
MKPTGVFQPAEEFHHEEDIRHQGEVPYSQRRK